MHSYHSVNNVYSALSLKFPQNTPKYPTSQTSVDKKKNTWDRCELVLYQRFPLHGVYSPTFRHLESVCEFTCHPKTGPIDLAKRLSNDAWLLLRNCVIELLYNILPFLLSQVIPVTNSVASSDTVQYAHITLRAMCLWILAILAYSPLNIESAP